MRFYSDNQRKAVFANIFDKKQSNKTKVQVSSVQNFETKPIYKKIRPYKTKRNSEKTIMSPTQFLRLSSKFPKNFPNKLELSFYIEQIEKKRPMTVLDLYYDLEKKEIVDHDGRHRALAFKKKGYKKVPVIIHYEKKNKPISLKNISKKEKINQTKAKRQR